MGEECGWGLGVDGEWECGSGVCGVVERVFFDGDGG